MKAEDAMETVGGEMAGSGDVADPKRWSHEEQLNESGEVKGMDRGVKTVRVTRTCRILWTEVWWVIRSNGT